MKSVSSFKVLVAGCLPVLLASVVGQSMPHESQKSSGGRGSPTDAATTTQSPPGTTEADLLQIIDRQQKLIEALRARIKELENAQKSSSNQGGND